MVGTRILREDMDNKRNIRIFSFAASCAGERSHTAEFSDILAEALRKKAKEEGFDTDYECMTGADLNVSYCRSCSSCFVNGICPLDDRDDMPILKEKMLSADILLFGTPVYAWQMSGIAKSVFDRISYWMHRYDLLGKTCAVYSTASASHGPEVAEELAQLMGFTGAVVINAGTKTFYGIEKDVDETAGRIMELYKDRASGVTPLQQEAFIARIMLVRKYFKNLKEGEPVVNEMRVLHERGLDRYDQIKEAIADLT